MSMDFEAAPRELGPLRALLLAELRLHHPAGLRATAPAWQPPAPAAWAPPPAIVVKGGGGWAPPPGVAMAAGLAPGVQGLMSGLALSQ
jgi:hypothetical protein